MTAAPKFTPYVSPVCVHCGRPIKDGRVSLELDQRITEYHDFGGVPENRSQGWFDFGPDCAAKLRKRARAALAKRDGGKFAKVQS